MALGSPHAPPKSPGQGPSPPPDGFFVAQIECGDNLRDSGWLLEKLRGVQIPRHARWP